MSTSVIEIPVLPAAVGDGIAIALLVVGIVWLARCIVTGRWGD